VFLSAFYTGAVRARELQLPNRIRVGASVEYLRVCFAGFKVEVLLYALGHEKTYATDLSDEEWACLRACLPELPGP
jgi:hypothetical protein